MQRIFLIGYMGVGKTTTGRQLAQTLGLEFIDMDHFIQTRFQKSVAMLFDEFGETEFRNIERKILHEIGDFEDVVVSTGGGAPCFFDNIDFMNEKGVTVYLKTSPELLSARLNTCKEKRPLIKDKSEDELYLFVKESLVKREPFYSKAKIVFENDELVSKEDAEKYVAKLIKAIQ